MKITPATFTLEIEIHDFSALRLYAHKRFLADGHTEEEWNETIKEVGEENRQWFLRMALDPGVLEGSGICIQDSSCEVYRDLAFDI